MPTTISKTAQVLKYFAQRYRATSSEKRGIPRTRLMKMAYLTDLLAREYLGDGVTDFRYYRYKHGPYDKAILGFIEELVEAGLAFEKLDDTGEYEYKRLVDAGLPIEFDFSPAETEILRYVATTYLTMPMQELLHEVVYTSTPMVEQPVMEQLLPMDSVNNRGTEAVGFKLEDVLRAEQEQSFPDFVMPESPSATLV